MAKKNKPNEEIEFEPLPKEDDTESSGIECKLCESETEIGKPLCEDCGQCASCGEEWEYKDAKAAKKTEDGQVCESCWSEGYSEGDEIEESDGDDDEDGNDEDEEYEEDSDE